MGVPDVAWPSWMVSPAGWGARKDYDSWSDPWVAKDKIAVHYGGGANTAGSVTGVYADQVKDEKAVLRGWESWHIDGRKWRGIAYCFAIGQSGSVYRLRGWNQNGAHYGNDDVDYDNIPENKEALPVVFILGGEQEPTPEAYAAFERLRAWLNAVLGLSLKAWGHREIAASGGHSTACPGELLMGYVRDNRYAGSPSSGAKPRDLVVWPDLLREGDEDRAVVALRAVLFSLGYYGKRYLRLERFDGRLGKRVLDFQREFGLTADGVVGPKTREALLDAFSKTVVE